MSYLERRQKREERVRTSQRRGQQSPYTSVTPPPARLPSLTGTSDSAFNMAGSMPPELDGYRQSRTPSSPSSNTDGEQALPLCWDNSSDDLSQFLGTLTTGFGTKDSLLATRRNLSQEPIQNAQMFFMQDQGDLHGLMGDSAVFGHAVGNEPLERNPAPMPYLLGSASPHTADSHAGSTDHSDDAVEYSLTCPLGKVKSLVQHLVDAAMPVSLEAGTQREQQVVLSLKLKKL